MTTIPPTDARIVAFIDIGTNSIRLLLVRILPTHSYTVLTQLKEMVRLGEGEFTAQRLQPQAINRTVMVARYFTELAQAHGADDIIAVATAATREATNQRAFINRLAREAQLEVRVVSGLEEARLTYLGVASGMHLDDKQAIFIDIGGGSTEIIVGTQQHYQYLNSLKLGAIRLTTLFLPDTQEPVPSDTYERIRQYIRQQIVHTLREIRGYPLQLAIGSSGTAENLADVAMRLFANRRLQRHDVISYVQLKKVIAHLSALPLEERRKVPGLNPARADIMIPGAAILDVLMEELSLPELCVTDRGLRDGLLIDYLQKNGHMLFSQEMSVRQRSVLQLGRACRFNETHGLTTARLAVALFDSARDAKLHRLGAWERELLEYAALLHHIGAFLTPTNYQAHTYYLIHNADLLGFNRIEVTIIATTALYHRKTLPRSKHPEFATLDKSLQRTVRILCVLLRLAENLDRSQASAVLYANLKTLDRKRAVLHLYPRQNCQIEIWGVEKQFSAFEKVFGRVLELQIVEPETLPACQSSSISNTELVLS